eukprot:3153078-Prymnesium_polylepis.1
MRMKHLGSGERVLSAEECGVVLSMSMAAGAHTALPASERVRCNPKPRRQRRPLFSSARKVVRDHREPNVG